VRVVYEAFSRVFRFRVGPTWNPSLAAQSASHEEVPVPENPTELKSFLGLVNYNRKFIPDMSTLVNPFNRLLAHDAPRSWTDACQETFFKLKETLLNSPVLAHYDPSQPTLFVWLRSFVVTHHGRR